MRISDWSSDVCSSDLLGEDLFDLAVRDRGRSVARTAQKTGDTVGVFHQVPGFVGQIHLDEHVAGENPALGNGLFTALDLDDFLRGHENAAEGSLQPGTIDTLGKRLWDTLFHSRVNRNTR